MSDLNHESKLARLRQVILDCADTLSSGDFSIDVHACLNGIITNASEVLMIVKENERMAQASAMMQAENGSFFVGKTDDVPN